MAKRRESQGQILERFRDERDLSKIEMSAALGISRQTYDAWLVGAEISVKHLSLLAIDHVGEWVGGLAVELLWLVDPRLVPCMCQTTLWDSGACPKHGVMVEIAALEVEQVAA